MAEPQIILDVMPKQRTERRSRNVLHGIPSQRPSTVLPAARNLQLDKMLFAACHCLQHRPFQRLYNSVLTLPYDGALLAESNVDTMARSLSRGKGICRKSLLPCPPLKEKEALSRALSWWFSKGFAIIPDGLRETYKMPSACI